MSGLRTALYGFSFAMALPALGQVGPGVGNLRMPPPITQQTLPEMPGAEARANFISGVVAVGGGYTDNLYPGSGKVVSDQIYSITSNLTFNRSSLRQLRVFTYSPGFTFYQPTRELDETDHFGSGVFTYRLSPHTTMDLRDTFGRSSNAFALGRTMAGGAASGTLGTVTPGVVAPFAEELSNNATGNLYWQFDRHGLVSGGGIFTDLRFTKTSEIPGLFDSTSRGWNGAYADAITEKLYAGVTYQDARMNVFPHGAASVVRTQTPLGFVTLYAGDNISISAGAGPQLLHSGLSSGKLSTSWFPAAKASLGWQVFRGSIAADYSRTVTGGGGLIGAYESTETDLATHWLVTAKWRADVSGAYVLNRLVGPALAGADSDGRTVDLRVALERSLKAGMTANFTYDRLHMNYGGVRALASSPDTNWMMFTLTYELFKPLGR